MSAVLTEYVFEYALRYGMDYIYNNQSILEEIFGQFKEDFLLARYGQDHLNSLKEFINEQQVEIQHAWRLDQFKTPSYTVQLTSEGEIYKALGDDHPSEFIDEAPADILTNVNVLSYDSSTGYLSLDLATDLTTIFSGHYIEDSVSESFGIVGAIIERPTEKLVFVGQGLIPEPQAGIGKFTSGPRKKNIQYGSIRMSNTVNIGIHHTEPHIVRYLYYIALYIFNRWKEDLFEKRGVELSTYSASDTARIQQFTPDNVFTRNLTVNCFTELVWDEGEAIIGPTLFNTRVADTSDETDASDIDDVQNTVCYKDFSDE